MPGDPPGRPTVAIATQPPGTDRGLIPLEDVRLFAEQTDRGVCVWAEYSNGKRFSLIWPFGYTARLDPLEIVDETGRTVARGGQEVTLVGAGAPRLTVPACDPEWDRFSGRVETEFTAEEQREEDIAVAIRFRESFGLRADRPWVEAVLEDPTASREYGTPLTPDEVVLVEERGGVSDSPEFEALKDYVADLTDTFGGLYIEHSESGTVVDLAVTDDPEDHRAEVERLAEGRFGVRVRQVRNTEAELDELAERIAFDEAFHNEIGVIVSGATTDIFDNVVEFSVYPLDDDIEATLSERYGTHRVRILPAVAEPSPTP